MEPYSIVVNFSVRRMWGKVGPFKDWKEAHEWSVAFRKAAVAAAGGVDMTAISGELFQEISSELCCLEYLPSKDAGEIIRNAMVTALFGV